MELRKTIYYSDSQEQALISYILELEIWPFKKKKVSDRGSYFSSSTTEKRTVYHKRKEVYSMAMSEDMKARYQKNNHEMLRQELKKSGIDDSKVKIKWSKA